MLSKPKPPAELDGEARKEWFRVCSELEQLGLLNSSDRAILIQYVQAWAINRVAADTVSKEGATIIYSNGIPAHTPAYKTWKDTTTLIRGMLNDLSLTPAARGSIDKQPVTKLGPLQF